MRWMLSCIVLLGIWLSRSSADTCEGRCNAALDNSLPCQCNSACIRYGDCCVDFSVKCQGESCDLRCGDSADANKPCQCNPTCTTYQDCCSDYQHICVDGGAPPSGGTTLSSVMDDIWDSDVGKLAIGTDIVINESGNRLFTSVNAARLSQPTFAAFINLLNNYERFTGVAEIVLDNDLSEIKAFVDLIMASEAMQLARAYLIAEGKVTASNFRSIIEELWFNLYSRSSGSSTLDSSGFEHVMVGELSSSTSVSGFHSWIQFYLEEQAGNLNYGSMLSTAEPSMKGASFTWHGANKGKGSFFLGTSPEFDLAVYSICATMYPNARCNFSLQGNSVSIQTWDIGHKTGNQIGSAYPAI